MLSQTGISLQATLVDHKVIAVTDSALQQYYNAHRDDYQQTTGTDVISYNALITALAGAASVPVDAGVLAAIQIS